MNLTTWHRLSVAQHVNVQRGLLSKTTAALLALKRFLSRVFPHVNHQVAFLCERLVTLVALIGPLSRVDPRMIDQVGLLTEVPPTELALVRLVLCMDLYVSYQSLSQGETFGAARTLVGFLWRSCFELNDELGGFS